MTLLYRKPQINYRYIIRMNKRLARFLNMRLIYF